MDDNASPACKYLGKRINERNDCIKPVLPDSIH